MKSPSASISASLRGQRQGVRSTDPVTVSRQRPANAASMRIPGDGGVCPPPGRVDKNSTKKFGDALGGMFGGK